jgi:hypothetical protein
VITATKHLRRFTTQKVTIHHNRKLQTWVPHPLRLQAKGGKRKTLPKPLRENRSALKVFPQKETPPKILKVAITHRNCLSNLLLHSQRQSNRPRSSPTRSSSNRQSITPRRRPRSSHNSTAAPTTPEASHQPHPQHDDHHKCLTKPHHTPGKSTTPKSPTSSPPQAQNENNKRNRHHSDTRQPTTHQITTATRNPSRSPSRPRSCRHVHLKRNRRRPGQHHTTGTHAANSLRYRTSARQRNTAGESRRLRIQLKHPGATRRHSRADRPRRNQAKIHSRPGKRKRL